MKDRKQMVEVNKKRGLFIRKQCRLLDVNRGLLYYTPQGESALNLELNASYGPASIRTSNRRCRIDGLLFGRPWSSGQFQTCTADCLVLWAIQLFAIKRNLSKLGQAKYVKPYLLRNLDIKRANQVWSTDITYIPMEKGFMYLTAIMDVYSRKILSLGIE